MFLTGIHIFMDLQFLLTIISACHTNWLLIAHLPFRMSFEVNADSFVLSWQTGGHKQADIDSAKLEEKFLENDKDVMEFIAGSQKYSLSFHGKQTICE